MRFERYTCVVKRNFAEPYTNFMAVPSLTGAGCRGKGRGAVVPMTFSDFNIKTLFFLIWWWWCVCVCGGGGGLHGPLQARMGATAMMYIYVLFVCRV